ncbi:MAG: sigma-70 family RNA polymerase sigma factor [Candidatus Omnitrophota bacterium]
MRLYKIMNSSGLLDPGIKQGDTLSNLWKAKMEDDILIERYLNGEEEGFTMLVQKYQERVLNIVHSLNGAVSGAEDIAQEVFVKVYKNLAYFNKKCQFSTWLYRITVNTAYNYFKREKRYTSLDNFPDIDDGTAQKTRDKLEAQEKQQWINKALEKLPFKFRSVVVLKDLEGLSYKDIAQTLGCRIGTVESRLFRARQMLKTTLSPILEKGV